ncbi:hypothetical protein R6Q59_005135 [Mikania micrantha]
MLGAQNGKRFQGQGPNWILIACGALFSTQENGELTGRKRPGNGRSHSNMYCFEQDDDYFNCISNMKFCRCVHTEPETVLPLAIVSASMWHVLTYNKERCVIWPSSPDRLELAQKPFDQSNSPGSFRFVRYWGTRGFTTLVGSHGHKKQ